MEMASTSEHLTVRGRYIYILCADFDRFEIDEKWEYHGLYQEAPGL